MTFTISRERRPKASVVKSVMFSHGTLECRDIHATRKFYEDFLGLDCVQIGPSALACTLGPKFHVVCLQTGEHTQGKLTMLNHWGVEVSSAREVEDAYQKALELKGEYELGSIMPIENVGGRYSFYFADRDNNWWEIQYYDGLLHDDFYDFGDVTEEFS